jgi:tRNA threonylcarbamoyladenosine biosynthesis protein TsaB
VPTLQILCEAAKSAMTNDHSPKTKLIAPLRQRITNSTLVPMIDARRMEVYTLAEDGKARAVVVENEESLINEQSDKVQCTKEYYYFGDGAEKCSKVFVNPHWHYIPNIVPEAQYVGVLAEQIKNHQSPITNKAIDIAYYEPYYLKEFIAAPSHVKGLQ